MWLLIPSLSCKPPILADRSSTPSGDDYDRPIVILNTLRLNNIQLLDDGKQVIGFPGSTLNQLEKRLKPYGREPHSVIGSSCIGASVVGGICNNSGGSLVQRGPAYTEMALYAQIDAQGELQLINHLGISLGNTPEEILQRLEQGQYGAEDIEQTGQQASDSEYATRVRDIDATTPSRFNADPRRYLKPPAVPVNWQYLPCGWIPSPVRNNNKFLYRHQPNSGID